LPRVGFNEVSAFVYSEHYSEYLHLEQLSPILLSMLPRWHSMKRFVPVILGVALLCATFSASISAQSNPSPASFTIQLRNERTHFLQCLAFVYDPTMWLSYNGTLYFSPRTEAHIQRLEEMKESRKNYAALTNRLARYELTAKTMTLGGINAEWQSKILLPYSNTNLNLTPTRELTVVYLPRYRVVQTFPAGDALLSDGADQCFVMGFGRAADDAFHTNAVLVREGTKSFKQLAGQYIQTDAFTDAGLSSDEIAVLRKAATAFMTEAASPAITNGLPSRGVSMKPAAPSREPLPTAAADEFLMHKMRARDDSPYMQFLLAKDYLQGLGTPKDEKSGIEWMQRAAANGSGDAKAYLETSRQK
jgi:hypothetical protein